MKINLPKLTGNNLIAIAITIAVTTVGLTYIITANEGQFDLCVYKYGISLQIKGQSTLTELKSRCLSQK